MFLSRMELHVILISRFERHCFGDFKEVKTRIHDTFMKFPGYRGLSG